MAELNRPLRALTSGLVGACALNLLHESVRRFVPNAPRADILGMRAIAKGLLAADVEPPTGKPLHRAALVGDLISNTVYYGAVGFGKAKYAWASGTVLGVLAGAGAVALPGPMGLGEAPTNRTTATQAMTVGWYLFGGLVTAATYRLLSNKK